jgi:hypothetical protein
LFDQSWRQCSFAKLVKARISGPASSSRAAASGKRRKVLRSRRLRVDTTIVEADMLDGAIAKAKAGGMQVRSVYADRGFGTSTGDAALARHRIRDPAIPRQQRAAPIERSRSWKRRYRHRNGLEGRISQLKRKGLRRTRLRSLEGAQTWVGASPSPTTCSG